MDGAFDFMGLLGALSLIGLLIKNAIVLIEEIGIQGTVYLFPDNRLAACSFVSQLFAANDFQLAYTVSTIQCSSCSAVPVAPVMLFRLRLRYIL